MLINETIHPIKNQVPGRNVLVISDTSEANYQQHAGRIQPGSGLGVVGNNKDTGCFLHPSLVIDADVGSCLGFSDIQQYIRQPDHADKHERGYKNLPIEDKESYRWLQGCESSKEVLKDCNHITFIQDREGDIYEQFVRVKDERCDLLIRSRGDRKIMQSEKGLIDYTGSQDLAGMYQVEIKADKRLNRKARVATLAVRFVKVSILRPQRLNKSPYPEHIDLYVVEAKEIGGSVPGDQEPVHWRLLTTHQVANFDQAIQIIAWYCMRWNIEQLFRTFKSQGVNIESSELESGEGLKKLGILAIRSALKIMQLTIARDLGEDAQHIDEVFTGQEQVCMQVLARKLEGKTEKLSNPNPREKLSWATWVIARLGGWKGYKSQRPPGPIIISRGVEKFDMIFQGWQIAHFDHRH